MKLNITPGPWVAEYESYVRPFKCAVLNNEAIYVLHGFKNDDISAIVNAVNNTYHKGINPEAVPEMLYTIKMCRALFESMGLQEQSMIGGEQYKFIKTTIQKATL